MNNSIRLLPLLALASVSLVGCNSKPTIIIFTAHEENRIQLYNKELKEKFPEYNIVIQSKTTGALMAELQAQGTRTTCDFFIGIEITNAEILLNANSNLFADLSSIDTSSYIDEVLEYQSDVTLSDGTVRNGHKKYNIQDKEAGCIVLNTKVLADRGLPEPESYTDLLDSKYKDLIIMPNPKSSGTGYYFYNGYASVYGDDAAKEYFSNLSKNVKEFSASGSGPVKGVNSGEIAIGLGMHFQAREYANKNENLKIKFFEEGSPYTLYTMGIINGKQSKTGVQEVYEYFFNTVNYLDNSQIVPETIYKNALTPAVENWVTPTKYTAMKHLLDYKYKEAMLDAWKW